MQIKISDLKLFVNVIEAGGMTQAVSLHGGSQPAMSRRLKDLEYRLQATLMHRNGRGVTLTYAGQIFFDYAKMVVDAYEPMIQSVTAADQTLATSLTMAVPMRLGRLIIPDMHKAMARSFPDVSVHIFEDTTQDIPQGLRDGQYDLALFYSGANVQPQDHELLFEEHLYLVGSPSNIGEDHQAIALADVASMPLLLPSGSPPFRKVIEKGFAHIEREPKVVRQLEIAETLLAFAMEGDGVAILSYSNIYQEVERGEVVARVIKDPPLARSLYMGFGQTMDHRLKKEVAPLIKRVMKDVASQARWFAPSH